MNSMIFVRTALSHFFFLLFVIIEAYLCALVILTSGKLPQLYNHANNTVFATNKRNKYRLRQHYNIAEKSATATTTV